MNRRFGLPLAASIAGHAALLAVMIMLLGRLPSPVPVLVPERAIVVTLAPPPSVQPPTPPQPAPAMPPKVEQPPSPKVEQPPPKIEKPPPPPPVVAKPPPPPPRPETVERREPAAPKKAERRRPVERRQLPRAERAERRRTERIERAERRPERAAPAPYRPAPPIEPPLQRAAVPRPPAPTRQSAPVVSAAYRAELSAWLQSHKRYPESARMNSEQGQVLLRFQVARSGRVLSYAIVRSSGYPALDAAVDAMMRGAVMPPFPTDMSAPDIQVTVAVRFVLGG